METQSLILREFTISFLALEQIFFTFFIREIIIALEFRNYCLTRIRLILGLTWLVTWLTIISSRDIELEILEAKSWFKNSRINIRALLLWSGSRGYLKSRYLSLLSICLWKLWFWWILFFLIVHFLIATRIQDDASGEIWVIAGIIRIQDFYVDKD